MGNTDPNGSVARRWLYRQLEWPGTGAHDWYGKVQITGHPYGAWAQVDWRTPTDEGYTTGTARMSMSEDVDDAGEPVYRLNVSGYSRDCDGSYSHEWEGEVRDGRLWTLDAEHRDHSAEAAGY